MHAPFSVPAAIFKEAVCFGQTHGCDCAMGLQEYSSEAMCGACVQASRLRSKLAEQKIPEEALWVTSPLTRAIDTLILACPQPQRLGPSIPPLADAEAGPSATIQPLQPFKVVVRRSVLAVLDHDLHVLAHHQLHCS